MKILLLSVNSSTFFYNQVVIPFGLASLGSYVQDDGHVIKGIEMNSPPDRISLRYLSVDEELLNEIIQFAPDLVAMSTYAENMHNVLFWAEIIKRKIPKAVIAVGGNHASYIAREILEKCNAVDLVVRFEGEIPFKLLCEKISRDDKNYQDVPNIVYYNNGRIIENEVTGLIDLDSLPMLNRSFFEQPSDVTHADAITARGCPYHCTFCDCNHFWGKKYRKMSPDKIANDLISFKSMYPNLKTVRIRDESVSINRKHAIELCQTINEKRLNLRFQAHSRLDGLTEDVITNLSNAGFNRLFIGLESGSQAVLDRLQKGIHIKNVHILMPLMRKYKIAPRFSLMLGTPEERLEEAIKTIELVNELGLSFDEFYFGQGLTIYPGTTDCSQFLERNPGYRWLGGRQELTEGYYQRFDNKGNVVEVEYWGAKYDQYTLNREINKRLKLKLAEYGEKDYFEFMSMRREVSKLFGIQYDVSPHQYSKGKEEIKTRVNYRQKIGKMLQLVKLYNVAKKIENWINKIWQG